MLSVLELQKNLVEAALPAGLEDRQAKLLAELARPYVDEVRTDPLGNVVCRKQGPGKKIVVLAHMDVIGFIVTGIDDNGFIRFDTIGIQNPLFLINAAIRFDSGLCGCIRSTLYAGGEPASFKKAINAGVSDLYIDIGAKDRSEAENLVTIGSAAVFDYETSSAASGNIITPYADGVSTSIALLLTMEKVASSLNDLYFVFTVQEHHGRIGEEISIRSINPSWVIAIEPAYSEISPSEAPTELSLGKGPVIRIPNSPASSDFQHVRYLQQVAEKAGIPCQTEVLPAGFADSAIVRRAQYGVPVSAVGIPMRNCRTPGELVNESDIVLVAKLLAAAVSAEETHHAMT